jgi:pimeloyl-ACP methyl ester carboxylesterase
MQIIGVAAFWASVILVITFIAAQVLRQFASTEPSVERTWLRRGSGRGALIIGVHGWMPKMTPFKKMVLHASSLIDGADVVVMKYRAEAISNVDPTAVAKTLESQIGVVSGSYDRIILIGHSSGAMLLRKAYLFSAPGVGRDDPRFDPTKDPSYRRDWEKRPVAPVKEVDSISVHASDGWWTKVDRFILFAGVNGGWDASAKAPFAMLAGLAGILGVGRFGRSLERGKPFVENLRIDWVRLCYSGALTPPIVLINGDYDPFLDVGVNRDLEASGVFKLISVPGASHAGVIDVGPDDAREDVQQRCRDALEEAVRVDREEVRRADKRDPAVQSCTIEAGSQQPTPVNRSAIQNVTDVVIILHGVRDQGGWSSKVRAALNRQSNGVALQHAAPRFKYVAMLPFILGARNKQIEWFAQAYTDVVIDYPNVERIHFWGHSYGTYIFANALNEYDSIRVNNVYLAGSVLPRAFPWREYWRQGRVENICNAKANADWVVAFFPALMDRVREWFDNDDALRRVGDAGFTGFRDPIANNYELSSLKGGHGAFLTKLYLDRCAGFVLHGETPDFRKWIDDRDELYDPPGLISFLNRLPFLAWLAALLAAIVVVFIGGFIGSFFGAQGQTWGAFIAALLVLAILLSA